MREILFRGKRSNGKWVEGGIFIQKEDEVKDFAVYIVTPSLAAKCNMYEVHPVTVGQYTGLKDKNGKRIFEGDIVKLWRSVGAKGDCRMAYRCPLVVEYCDLWAQFVVADNPMKEQYSLFDFQAIEVIGNIHDNGELMEVR